MNTKQQYAALSPPYFALTNAETDTLTKELLALEKVAADTARPWAERSNATQRAEELRRLLKLGKLAEREAHAAAAQPREARHSGAGGEPQYLEPVDPYDPPALPKPVRQQETTPQEPPPQPADEPTHVIQCAPGYRAIRSDGGGSILIVKDGT